MELDVLPGILTTVFIFVKFVIVFVHLAAYNYYDLCLVCGALRSGLVKPCTAIFNLGQLAEFNGLLDSYPGPR